MSWNARITKEQVQDKAAVEAAAVAVFSNSQSLTPLVGGDTGIARRIVRNTAPTRMLLLGDSIVLNTAFLTEMFKRWRVPVVSDWYCTPTNRLTQTDCYNAPGTPAPAYGSYVAGLLGGLGTYAPFGSVEYSFIGGTTGADSNVVANRTISSASWFNGAPMLTGAANCYAGSPILKLLTAGKTLTTHIPVRQNTAGLNQSVFYLQHRGGSDQLQIYSTSSASPANAYAAADVTLDMSLALPAAGVSLSYELNMDVRIKAATVCTNGKNIVYPNPYWITSGETGFGCYTYGVASTSIDWWLDSLNVSDEMWSTFIPMLGFTDLGLYLGLNNQSGNNAAQHAAKLVLLAAKFRTGVPNGSIIVFAPHPMTTQGGGLVDEAYHVAGGHTFAVSDPSALFLNVHQAFPRATGDVLEYNADDTHLLAQGHAVLADVMWSLMSMAAAADNPLAV